MNRRSFLKRLVGSGIALLGLSGGGYFYARDIEPKTLQITKEQITSPNIPAAFERFKIIQFSDTHLGFHYTLTQLEELVSTINQLEPDLIVFTGDLIDEPQTYKDSKPLIEILQKLHATNGKFWIYGNHDHGGYGTDMIKDIMDQSGFDLLQNNHVKITRENKQIILAGIDDTILGMPDIVKTLQHANPELFTILLSHTPDFADIAINHPVNIQLSGHSHGGQVRLPFIGHLYTPIHAEKYTQGKYTLNGGKFALYVNQGIGTTRLPFRFFCKPELHELTLVKH